MQAAAEVTAPARWLSIIGIGEDGISGLTPTACTLIENAVLVVGGTRHLQLATPLIRGKQMTWPSPLDQAFADIAARRGTPVVILATGDPNFYGIGKQLAEHFAQDETVCLPQPSAFSLAAAHLGWALQDTALVTVHGRALSNVIRHLHDDARILVLSWDGATPAALADILASRGFGASQMTVLEALGGPRERIRTATAGTFDVLAIAPLNTVAVQCIASRDALTIPLTAGLDDDAFENDGQLTKRDIRALTLADLRPSPGELLWDVGLGAGSVAIEWLLRHSRMRAIGIEERPERAARAARNAASLGAPDLKIIIGEAPGCLTGLDAPDAIFIGGGFADDGVFEACWRALRPGGRLVVNAIALETEQRLLAAFDRHGGKLKRVHIAKAERVGTMHGWRPAIPVTQWSVVKP